MARTVLVVEDEADILMLEKLILELSDYLKLEAATAEDALKVIEREVPDAVLLDLRLPGMDGWELLDVLKEKGLLPGLPVVLVTADAAPSTKERAIEAGCRAYLSKPFSVEQLKLTLKSLTVE